MTDRTRAIIYGLGEQCITGENRAMHVSSTGDPSKYALAMMCESRNAAGDICVYHYLSLRVTA